MAEITDEPKEENREDSKEETAAAVASPNQEVEEIPETPVEDTTPEEVPIVENTVVEPQKVEEPIMTAQAATVMPKAPEITYSAKEFAVSGAFSCPPECVMAAFKQNNIVQATQEEAKKTVKEFLTQEVK
ncbi:hypothetical protein [Acetobacterium tundrae]|uniref:YqzN/YkzM domain-containing protein n=1 Tax=Acetobacterium tundrae TaxID=132932 RepID=A0ABR6WNK4_9FIRM|nr:hypothetical protein [Acetobacterium tundrae]MBC3798029.1 hypothetical protein [Acetobacterium tundrae]